MPPKKIETALLADVAEHRRWAVANLTALRARSGPGLKERLQQRAGPEEHRTYNWYVRHARVVSDHPRVVAALRDLDALVDGPPGPAAPACSEGAPPAKQRRLTEKSGEVAACAAQSKGESGPGQSTASSTGRDPATASAKASLAPSLPTGRAKTPAKRPRPAAGGNEATPARATGEPQGASTWV